MPAIPLLSLAAVETIGPAASKTGCTESGLVAFTSVWFQFVIVPDKHAGHLQQTLNNSSRQLTTARLNN
jgi:hypothetical protein